ncbi:hypothetical protein ACWEN6_13940 [Sphaerisporangium sp. NPDC004334]
MVKPTRARPAGTSRLVAQPEQVIAGDQAAAPQQALAEAEAASPVQLPAAVEVLGNKFVSQLDADSSLQDIETRITTITNEYVAEVGQLLGLVRDNEKWSTADYTSWEEYLRLRWDWTPQYANLLIRLVPMVKALSEYSDRPINASQGKELWPVWTQDDGRSKVIEVFKATPGKKSGAALKRTAIAMGYLTQEPEGAPAPSDPPLPRSYARFREFAELVNERDGAHLIEVAKADPDWGKGALLPALRQAVWTLESEFGSGDDTAGQE